MKETKRRAKQLCRHWRLRGTALLLFCFAVSVAAGGAAAGLLFVRPRLFLPLLVFAAVFFAVFRLETKALALRRATGVMFSTRQQGRAYLRLALLPAVRLSLAVTALLPAAGLFFVLLCWRAAGYPMATQRPLLGCCLLLSGVSLVFFLRWNALLRAAPLFLLCGASLWNGLRDSARLTAGNKKKIQVLRRGCFPALLLCLAVLPLPFALLYRAQFETLLFLNEA